MHVTLSFFGFCLGAVFMSILLHACYFFVFMCWTRFGFSFGVVFMHLLLHSCCLMFFRNCMLAYRVCLFVLILLFCSGAVSCVFSYTHVSFLFFCVRRGLDFLLPYRVSLFVVVLFFHSFPVIYTRQVPFFGLVFIFGLCFLKKLNFFLARLSMKNQLPGKFMSLPLVLCIFARHFCFFLMACLCLFVVGNKFN